jgi:hypothetical protein
MPPLTYVCGTTAVQYTLKAHFSAKGTPYITYAPRTLWAGTTDLLCVCALLQFNILSSFKYLFFNTLLKYY